MITKEEIDSKLGYLGLDLTSVPEELKQFKGIEYLPTNLVDENSSRLYTYIPVSKIDILLTSHAEDASFSAKFSDAISIDNFLRKDSESDVDMKNYSMFLGILSTLKEKRIDEIEKEQKSFNKEEPFMVSYHSSSYWNIYYSKKSERYFMIVSTKENEFSELFYLIKKKLKQGRTGNEEYIYAPITLMPYTERFLRSDEILELENNIWYYARKWPLTYELLDKDGNYKLILTGYTDVYDKIVSPYRLVFNSKEEAIKYSKFVKALYTLEKKTEKQVHFTTLIKKDCSLGFRFKRDEIAYADIQSFVFLEYEKLYNDLIFYGIENLDKKDKADEIKKRVELKKAKLNSLQSEIILFSEAKKSFFGKFRYFFKKDPLTKVKEETERVESVILKEDDTNSAQDNNNEEKIRNEFAKLKLEEGFATIEEYIALYDEYKVVLDELKKSISDINSQKLLEKNLDYKIENAIKYLSEVGIQKRNIISFFKYTNSSNMLSLTEAEKEIFIDKVNEEDTDDEIEGVLNISFEYDIFGNRIDRLQRSELTKEEIDSIFLTSAGALKYINMLKAIDSDEKLEILEQFPDLDEELVEIYLRELKQEFEEKEELKNENFDIFGGLVGQKVRYIKDKAFRETKREKFAALKFNMEMSRDELISKLKTIANNLKTATDKIKINRKIDLYKVSNWSGDLKLKQYDIYNLDLNNEIDNISEDDYTYNIFKITMHKGMNMLFYANNIFYGNSNATLPAGMDISSQVLVDMARYTFIERVHDKIRVAIPDSNGKVRAKNFNIKEYRVVEKHLMNNDEIDK